MNSLLKTRHRLFPGAVPQSTLDAAFLATQQTIRSPNVVYLDFNGELVSGTAGQFDRAGAFSDRCRAV